MSLKKHKILIILGAPKSGISLLADCFSILETDSASKQDIILKDSMLIHGLFCQDIGIDSITAGSLPDKWQHSAAAEKAENRIRILLTNPDNKNSTWIMADPFICFTLPLWEKVFDELNIIPIFVHIIRHPWETANSLTQSTNIDLHKGYLIWLNYNYKALSIRLSHPYAMISFDQLLENPVSELSHIANALGIEYSDELQMKHHTLLDFVQPGVKSFHAGGATEVDKAAFAPFFSFYDQLCAFQKLCAQKSIGESTDKSFPPVDFKQIMPNWDMLEFILKEIGKYEQKECGKENLIANQNITQASTIMYLSFFLPRNNDAYREEKIILSGQGWEKISIRISEPKQLVNNKLKIAPLNTNGTVYIASIRIVNRVTNAVLWEVRNAMDFDQLILEGSVVRLPDQNKMVLLITGDDPCFILPLIEQLPDCPMDILVWLKASRDQRIVHDYVILQKRELYAIEKITGKNRIPSCVTNSFVNCNLLPASNLASDSDVNGRRLSVEHYQYAESSIKLIIRSDSISDAGVAKQIFQDKQYEFGWLPQGKNLYQLHSKILKSGKKSLIIDAGANIGASCLFFLHKFNKDTIFAIEPDIYNCEMLKLNCTGQNVILFEGALSDKYRVLYLRDPGLGDWGFRVEDFGEKQVECLGVDDILSYFNDKEYMPFILKLDIEGGEKQVFKGSCEWLTQIPLVIIELHDWMLPASGSSQNFIRAMAHYSFEIISRGENLFCFNRMLLNNVLPS